MIETLLARFGYPALFVGTFLEGETILVLGGFAAHRGYLSLPGVVIAAFLGTLFGDQLFYFFGRRHADWLLRRRPTWQPRLEQVGRLVDAHPRLIILGFRFLYGMRTVTPFALGISGVPPRLFIPLNLLGAAAWAVMFGGLGYLFGAAMTTLITDIKRYELWLALLVVGVGAVVWGWYLLRGRLKK